MDENKKYTVIGRVEIGTDEYRDLIEAVAQAKADSTRNNNQWYEERQKNEKLRKDVESLTKKVQLYENFLASDIKLAQALCNYKAMNEVKNLGGSDEY